MSIVRLRAFPVYQKVFKTTTEKLNSQTWQFRCDFRVGCYSSYINIPLLEIGLPKDLPWSLISGSLRVPGYCVIVLR